MIIGLGLIFSTLARTGSATAADAKQSGWTLAPIFEERERFERRDHKGFSEAVSDARSDWFDRTRAGFSFTDSNKLSGEVVYQYTNDVYQTAKANGELDNSDLLLAFVKDTDKSGTYTVGRQRLSLLNQRLLGESDWKVASNSWDALRYQKTSVDIFAGHLESSTYESQFTKLVGGDYTSSVGTVLGYYAHDRVGPASTDIYTLYDEYKSDLKFAKLDAELGGQLGAAGMNQVRAWMASARLNRDFGPKISGRVEASIFSGGTEPGTIMEWTAPYGTKHSFGGYGDIQGSDNAKWLSAEANYKWAPKFNTEIVYYDFFLENDKDAWMSKNFVANKTGSTAFISPTGVKGSQVGQELDLAARWDFAKGTEFSFGAADFFPGQFIKNFVSSSNLRDQMWFFAEFGYKFHG